MKPSLTTMRKRILLLLLLLLRVRSRRDRNEKRKRKWIDDDWRDAMKKTKKFRVGCRSLFGNDRDSINTNAPSHRIKHRPESHPSTVIFHERT